MLSKRRLLIRPGAIGDFILSIPALKHLCSDNTEVWCASQNVPIAQFANSARSIATVGLDRVGLLPDSDVRERLVQFDEIHSWYGTASAAFRDAVAAFPFRFYEALPRDLHIHATEFYCRQVGAPLSNPHIDLPETSKSNFAILHPFASRADKRWALERFQRLERLLNPPLPCAWCRGPEETLAGAVYIPDLLALAKWIAAARVYIGNDSGITHLAAACGVPVVALFGPSNAEVWAPRGRHVKVIEAPSLAALEPDAVFAVARTLI